MLGVTVNVSLAHLQRPCAYRHTDADSFSAAEMYSPRLLRTVVLDFHQLVGPVGSLNGVIRLPKLPGKLIDLLLQITNTEGWENLDFRMGSTLSGLARSIGGIAQDGYFRLEHIPPGQQRCQRLGTDEDAVVGTVDLNHQLLQPCKAAIQLRQQLIGVFRRRFTFLHQSVLVETTAQLFQLPVQIGTLLKRFSEFDRKHLLFVAKGEKESVTGSQSPCRHC